MKHDDTPDPSHLGAISTHWSVVKEPSRFLLRYSAPIWKYLHALLPDPNDAEEVAQSFFLMIAQNGFERVRADRGRFRHYLIASVRNAARAYLRRRHGTGHVALYDTDFAEARSQEAETRWIEEWRQCILQQAWRALHQMERHSQGSVAYTLLQLRGEHPEADTAELVELVAAKTGIVLKPDALRKQLSRARQSFAQLLVRHISDTLDAPGRADIDEELRDLGLAHLVGPYLEAADP